MKLASSLILGSLFAACAVACSSGSSKEPGGATGGGGGGGQGGSGTPGAAGTAGAAGAAGAPIVDETAWVGTWATAPVELGTSDAPPAPGLVGNTLRQVVMTSVGGEGFRVQLSNLFGSTPLTLDGVHAAIATGGGNIDGATDVALTFAGEAGVTIPAGEQIFSDPVLRPLPAMTPLALSVQISARPSELTGHSGSRATSWLAPGNALAAATLADAVTTTHWYFLTGVDVLAPDGAAVAVLGDSLTDGLGSTVNQNRRWPDALSRRFRENTGTERVGVLNLGIGGNALLAGGLGPTGRARYQRDILDQRGVHWVVLFLGVNDIGGSSGTGIADTLSESYQELIDVAHSRDLYVYGASLLPFGGSQYEGGTHEDVRQLVNEWIRTSGAFDGVLEFDEAVRDPASLPQLLTTYDSGDGLHLNDTGYQALADAVDLGLFSDLAARPGTGGEPLSVAPGYPCTNFAPASALINDFSTWSNGSWGTSGELSGGTFYYDGDGDSAVQALSLSVGAEESGTLTGSVSGGYAGFGFWFGSCTDASQYQGLSFTLSGDLGDAQLELQLQISHNYPIDDGSSKGECQGTWSTCTNPKTTIPFTTSDTPTPFQIPWTDLTGGQPTSGMDPTEILGIQWQLNCASGAECPVNVVLDDLQFY